MTRIKELWRDNRLMFIGFVLAVAITGYFVVRTALFTIYWANPANHDREIMPWMTVRYVSHSWEIPPQMVDAILGSDHHQSGRGRPGTMGRIALEKGITLIELNAMVAAAAQAFREGTGYQEFRHGNGQIER
ncbi:MAG: hypothetical protein GY945_12990 [Rhodobacteraceae bacterium]|nr:hypothetical protein [Paracoccaceae bacterium]